MHNFKHNAYEKRSMITETVLIGDLSASNLYTEGFVEIDQVVSGSGVHHILDQAIPCEEGDLCVLCSYTPHRYEGEESHGLVIRRILFDPKFFWEGDLGNADHPRFCYGVFCECLLLSYQMQDHIVSLGDFLNA